jgi:hypothetical protein
MKEHLHDTEPFVEPVILFCHFMFIIIPKLEGTMLDSLFVAEELSVMDNSTDIRKKVTKQVDSNGNA